MFFDDDDIVDNRVNLANANKFIANLPPELPTHYLNHSPYTKEVYVEWHDPNRPSHCFLPYAQVCFDQEDYGLMGYSYCYVQGTTYVGGDIHTVQLSDPFPEDLYKVIMRN